MAAELVKCGKYHLFDIVPSSNAGYETADLIIDTCNKKPNEIAIEILHRLAEA